MRTRRFRARFPDWVKLSNLFAGVSGAATPHAVHANSSQELDMDKATNRWIAELIGTFTLVFIGTAVATLQGLTNQGSAGWLGICFAFGFTLMVLVWTIGPVSGRHVNPAVTIAMALSGRQKWSEAACYILAQCAGAFLASFALLTLLKGIPSYSLSAHGLGANGNPLNMKAGALISWELIMTALFLFTIFSV